MRFSERIRCKVRLLTPSILAASSLANMAFQENLTGKGLKPMLTNDDAAKMLGVSKRTLQRMRSENRIDFIKIGNQCRYKVEAIERMVEERTITKET